MDSEEDDYMSDTFLLKCADTRPGLSREKPGKRKNKARAPAKPPPKSLKVQERETREAGMQKSLGEDNKGFRMLQKMGFKPGTNLGKEKGAGRSEPVPINLPDGRKGLGHATRQREHVQQQKVRQSWMALQRQKMEAGYRGRLSERSQESKVEHYLRKSQHVCEQLDERKEITIPRKSYFWQAQVKEEEAVEEEDEEEEDDEKEQQKEEELLTEDYTKQLMKDGKRLTQEEMDRILNDHLLSVQALRQKQEKEKDRARTHLQERLDNLKCTRQDNETFTVASGTVVEYTRNNPATSSRSPSAISPLPNREPGEYHVRSECEVNGRRVKTEDCEDLSAEDADIQEMTIPMKRYFWQEQEEEKEAKEENQDTKEQEQEYVEKQEQDDVKENEEEELTTAEKLETLTGYLRSEYFYCIWCGTAYDDAEDLKANCPGDTAADHDD